jgi:hypothetical protein
MAAAPSVSTKGFAFFAFRRRLVVVVLCVCVRIDKKLGCGGERATHREFLEYLGVHRFTSHHHSSLQKTEEKKSF